MWQGANGRVQNPIELAATQYLMVNLPGEQIRITHWELQKLLSHHTSPTSDCESHDLRYKSMAGISHAVARVLASLIQRPFWERTPERFPEILDQLAHNCASLK